jgi:hypothetical protein
LSFPFNDFVDLRKQNSRPGPFRRTEKLGMESLSRIYTIRDWAQRLLPAIPATWDADIRGSRFKASLGKMLRPPCQQRSQCWWHRPVIPATKKVQGGESWSEASPRQNV